jgi:hypothetical protein
MNGRKLDGGESNAIPTREKRTAAVASVRDAFAREVTGLGKGFTSITIRGAEHMAV